jgi:hypothetical protein
MCHWQRAAIVLRTYTVHPSVRKETAVMPHYLVERTFSARLALPGPQQAVHTRLTFIDNNALEGVTWVHSYIAPDRKKSFPRNDTVGSKNSCGSIVSIPRRFFRIASPA